MNGNAKRTAFLLLALASSPPARARGASAVAAQDPAAALADLSMELARYVKNDWCGMDLPARTARWARFYSGYAPLFLSPAMTKDALVEFFRRSIASGVVEHDPGFFSQVDRGMNVWRRSSPPETMDNDSAILLPLEFSSAYPKSVRFFVGSLTWNQHVLKSMSSEGVRWEILLAAKQDFSSLDETFQSEQFEAFRRDFPEPEEDAVVCGEALTKGIDSVPLPRLGASALLTVLVLIEDLYVRRW